MTVNSKKTFSADRLEDFCHKVLVKAGLPSDQASLVADTLLFAELRGVESHGLVRLETYLKRIQSGVMDPSAPINLEKDDQAVALLNANNAFGQIAAYQAMNLAVDKAGQYGTGVVAVKNSNHFGVAAYFAMLALKADMVGFVLTNASPAMAVYGTTKPLIGTNPLAIAVPAGERLPIVLDMSTSVVARGKIRNAALKGQEIPLGWARDKEGNPTTDPRLALEGTLEPVGGPKGSALSLIIDILCGLMTDCVLTGGVKNINDFSGPAKTGHFFAALNIAKFIDVKLFKARVDQVISQIKSMPPVAGGEIFLPGEIEHGLSERKKRDGVALDEEVVLSLNRVGDHYGVSLEEFTGSKG